MLGVERFVRLPNQQVAPKFGACERGHLRQHPRRARSKTFTRRRLCFLAIALAELENFDPSRLRYSLRQPASQPTWLSSRPKVAHDVPVKDSVSSWVSSQASEQHSRGQPISSRPSTPSLTPHVAVCVLISSAPVRPRADASRVAGSFSLTSLTS